MIPPALGDLPRVGTVLRIPATGTDRVTWFGPVRHEGYPDRALASPVERLTQDVAGLFTPYLRPQESGGRCGVRWLRLDGAPEDTNAPGICLHLGHPSQVSLVRHTAQDLDAATHHDELVPGRNIVIHLDAAHRGLGTASCGPDTLPEYLVGPGTYRWSWLLSTCG